MSSWNVGQAVIVRRPVHRGPAQDTEEVISRVGRKYVYVAGRYGREDAYDAETGIQKDGGNYARRIYVPEVLTALDRRAALEQRLRDATKDYGWYRNLTDENIRRIITIVEASA